MGAAPEGVDMPQRVGHGRRTSDWRHLAVAVFLGTVLLAAVVLPLIRLVLHLQRVEELPAVTALDESFADVPLPAGFTCRESRRRHSFIHRWYTVVGEFGPAQVESYLRELGPTEELLPPGAEQQAALAEATAIWRQVGLIRGLSPPASEHVRAMRRLGGDRRGRNSRGVLVIEQAASGPARWWLGMYLE